MQPLSHSPRQEDFRLLTGGGQFVDDLQPDHELAGYVVRSPYPHAAIRQIDTAAARQSTGVKLILTAADLAADGIGGLPCVSSFATEEGPPIIKPTRPLLATDRVRHVGEPVAFIVADTLNHAIDAAECLDIEYEALPSVSDVEKALAGDLQIWDAADHNLCSQFSRGDAAEVERQFAASAHVCSIKVYHPRVAITPIEPRSAVAHFDTTAQQWVLNVQTQGVHMIHRVLCQDVLHLPKNQLRVVTNDVGGSFGVKIFPYPEYALVLLAGFKTGRAVKWTATRAESFLSDCQGRARVDYASIGFDENGRITAYQCDSIADLGAYLSYVGPSIASVYAYTVVGHTYKITQMHFRNRGVFTNATPTDAYRGAGKPETVCTLEQLLDKAAFEMKVDRLELRRKNLVRPADLPYRMLNGQTIDSGHFEALMDRAIELSAWHDFPARRMAAEKTGRLRGIGLGMYMHSTGGSVAETCRVELAAGGLIRVFTGTQTGGQGHATALATLVAEVMEISPAKVEVTQGDTAKHAMGSGTGGSSLVAIAGTTVTRAARDLLNNAHQAAADLLEARVDDIAYSSGEFYIVGTDRRLTLTQLSAKLGTEPGAPANCVGQMKFDGENTTHPCGAYVVELECDPETGELRLVQLVGVDDIGRILFPQLADGQLHGSWAQAIGTSLMEIVRFDEDDDGQLLSGSLMDYQLPRALDLPSLTLDKLSTPCTTNAMGVKGVGEVASLGAPGAIGNALSDLLSTAQEFVVVKPPATSHSLWMALQNHTLIN